MGPKGKAAEKAVGKPSGNVEKTPPGEPSGKPSKDVKKKTPGEPSEKPSKDVEKKPPGEPPEQPPGKPEGTPSEKAVGTPGPEVPPTQADRVSLPVKCFWVFIAIMTLASLASFTVTFLKYWSVKTAADPYDEPMRLLIERLAQTLQVPEMEGSTYPYVASTMENLPNHFQDANLEFDSLKTKYRSLLYKATRSASGPWKLHRRSLYYFSKGEKTWYDAENFCLSRDGHLASILDNEEQNFISSHLQNISWIGLTLEKEDGKWRWSDGSTVEKQYWSDGKPSTAEVSGQSSQDCAVMVPSLNAHHWDDENCHKLYRWICKENLDKH